MGKKTPTGFKPGSKKWKNFMAKMYGWGAAVVILGALFKIEHFPGAGPMLIVGLGTEALIFFFSAFEPLKEAHDWSLVYPELGVPEDGELAALEAGDSGMEELEDKGTITEQLDNMLEEAKIGPELIDSLGQGLQGLSENAARLNDMSDASVATDEYVANMKGAAQSANDLSHTYSRTASEISSSAGSLKDTYEQSAQELASSSSQLSQTYADTASQLREQLSLSEEEGSNYKEELHKFTGNLSSLNSAYEIQLKGAEDTNRFYEGVSELIETLNDSLEDTKKYKENMSGLVHSLSALNTVYGNMLTAMSGTPAQSSGNNDL